MLGYMVYKVLARESDLAVSGTHRLDKMDPLYFDREDGLKKLGVICQQAGGFDYFINCIGITADRIKVCDSKSLLSAINVNAVFPHELATFAENHDSRVIHISTDGVFSGHAESHDESSPPNCVDDYGRMKCLGEAISDRVLNIRCSIIGPSPYTKGGLYEWFISHPEKAIVSGYTNHYWNGSTTLQFAELCRAIIEGNHYDTLRSVSSIFHFVPNDSLSKYELLKLFQTMFREDITVVPTEHPGGPVRRILKSKYRELELLYKCDIPMAKVIHKMKLFEQNK
ncbi:MAG: dTDP-4-dehydrorhamnose reductase [Parcubacteria group bacterium GW2011_GWC2_38_7]|nr:MAG: dTDP-4-dehydrorhamnose reductase [Parcubacteria group bacterium GW2011_GWC2_38_7]